MKTKIFLYLSIGFLLSCSGTMSTKKYVNWIEKINGDFIKEYQNSSLYMKCFIRPEKYLELRNLPNREEAISFNFYISSPNKSASILYWQIKNKEEYAQRQNYFLNEAQHDFFLTCNTDTLYPIGYHFEQSYGSSPINSIVLAFNEPIAEAKDQYILHYIDNIMESGIYKFTYSVKDFQKANLIKLKP